MVGTASQNARGLGSAGHVPNGVTSHTRHKLDEARIQNLGHEIERRPGIGSLRLLASEQCTLNVRVTRFRTNRNPDVDIAYDIPVEHRCVCVCPEFNDLKAHGPARSFDGDLMTGAKKIGRYRFAKKCRNLPIKEDAAHADIECGSSLADASTFLS